MTKKLKVPEFTRLWQRFKEEPKLSGYIHKDKWVYRTKCDILRQQERLEPIIKQYWVLTGERSLTSDERNHFKHCLYNEAQLDKQMLSIYSKDGWPIWQHFPLQYNLTIDYIGGSIERKRAPVFTGGDDDI